ncbi:MAG: glycosyltransferase family 4 protein [Coleofasciculus sp. C1-SOL-03]|uniref:glycosyltransferase family 4 protein n=1 Tax=Coleofasciculus sp. C1-SOL-03 TaxID=3069522 RepID=UPI0032F68DBC
MKILFISSAAMDEAWQKWEQHNYPGHRLFGATELPKYGIDIDILPHEKYTKLKQISNQIKILGDLDQQLRILFQQSDYDLVYSGHDINIALLTFLRRFGLYRKPIVAIMHRSFKHNLWSRIYVDLFIKGKDRLICLSSVIRDRLRDWFGIPESKLVVLELGVDLAFYDLKQKDVQVEQNLSPDNQSQFILSLGKTYRDYNTLIQAFAHIHYPLKIYCSANSASTVANIPANVKLNYDPTDPANSAVLSFEQLVNEYTKAYAVAIPLDIPPERTDSVTLTGCMSLIEAMAMGKAVVMTRNRQFSLDVEKEGIGIYVEPGDARGWQKAISYLLDNPQETQEMGQRGRRLCETQYNLDYFGSKLAEELKSVCR